MNLATARSATRSKEVGIRKVMGAKRSGLIRQFFSESMFFAFAGLFFAVLMVELLLLVFNDLAGKKLKLVSCFKSFSISIFNFRYSIFPVIM
jgi:putative ABC transport system permease protein